MKNLKKLFTMFAILFIAATILTACSNKDDSCDKPKDDALVCKD